MPGKPTSCALVADCHHGLTEGVRGLLQSAYETVVMVADPASLLVAAQGLQPEVAVADLSLARDLGLGWMQEIRQRCPGLKLVVLSIHDEECVRRAALAAGADRFVLKRAIATDLLAAIDAVRGHRHETAAAEFHSPDVEAPGAAEDTEFYRAK